MAELLLCSSLVSPLVGVLLVLMILIVGFFARGPIRGVLARRREQRQRQRQRQQFWGYE